MRYKPHIILLWLTTDADAATADNDDDDDDDDDRPVSPLNPALGHVCYSWREDYEVSFVLLADRILLHHTIGYWHHHVVRPSLRLFRNCGFQGRCTGLKAVFLARKFLFVRADTFTVVCIV